MKSPHSNSTADPSPEGVPVHAHIPIHNHRLLCRTFENHGLGFEEAIRMGLNLFAAVFPVLSRGGQLVLREKDGRERTFHLPNPTI